MLLCIVYRIDKHFEKYRTMTSLKDLSLDALEKVLPSDLLEDLANRRINSLLLPKILDINIMFSHMIAVEQLSGRETVNLLKEFAFKFPDVVEKVEDDVFCSFILQAFGDEKWEPRHIEWMNNTVHRKGYGITYKALDPTIISKEKKTFYTLVNERIQGYQMHNDIFTFFYHRRLTLDRGFRFVKYQDW